MVIARSLERALSEAGHWAAIITTPSNRFGRQASAYLANWLTDVGRTGDGAVVDHVISLRYPSYAVRHPHHVCWLNHTMREYYDLWEEFSGRLSARGRVKERARRALIHATDTYLLRRNVTRVMAQSATVRDRLRRWNGIEAEVLHPPAPPRPYRCDEYGESLFLVSRLRDLFEDTQSSSNFDFVTLQVLTATAPLLITLGLATGIGVLFVYATRWQRWR